MVRKKPKIPQLHQLPQTQKSGNWFDRISSPYLQEYEKLSEEDKNKLLSYSNQTTKRNTGIGSFDPQAINSINSLVKGLLGVDPTTGRNSGGGSFDPETRRSSGGGSFDPETVKMQNAQNSWFKAGGLSDGYDFGDLTLSNLASTGDFLRHVGKGAFGVAEGVTDTLLYGMSEASGLVGDVASYFGLEKAENVARFTDAQMKELAMEDSATKLFGGTGDWLDEMSYLGGKTDSVAEGVGQVAATVLLAKFAGASGINPTLLTSGTMFASSLGRGITEALNSGASDEEAWLYGLISGTADAATEMLFGGIGKGINALGFSRGITSLDDIVAKNITGKISNTLMKNIAQAGIKGGFEGLEEVLAGFAQAWGKSVTYLKDEVDSGKIDFWDIVKDENLFEQWITGALTSAISSAPSVTQATVKGQDYITGYTKNDQAVIDRVIKDLISEAEAAGQKLTAKDKANIKAKVEEDLEQGHISLDTIEETLGGDKYTAYQDTIQQENNALAELAELYEGDELQQKAEEFMANSKRGEAAKALRDSVFDLVKDSRLGESYREVGRRTQKFEVDLNQYTDEKQRAIVQKAVESGVLNNTNRTHDMVNWVSSMAAKMDTNFDFTNNEKLKDSIFAVDGKTVDGYVTKDGIVINVNSPKYINTVVGHEITHVLEGSNLYDDLESTMIEYAKEKGTYQDVMKAAYEMYHNVEGYQGADGLKKIKKEAVANMVGDYLFTDQNFINHLAKNQNVFQKVWNEVKYMVKIARAGSNEHKKLLEVQRAFEKAYREGAQNNTAGDSGVQYSIRNDIVDVNGKEYDIVVELDKTVSKSTLSNPQRFMGYIENNLVGLQIPVVDSDGNIEIIEFAKPGETTSKNGKRHPVLGELAYTRGDTRKQVIVNAQEVAEVSAYDPVYSSNNNEHGWLDENGWESRKTYVLAQDGMLYEAYLKIAKTRDGRNILYGVNLDIKNGIAVDKGATLNRAAVLAAMPSGETVAQENQNVKYSISPEQEAYFKDSVVRDENGNLKVMYHGTPNGDFTIFKDGTYFTDNKAYADRYQNPGASSISTGKTASNPKTFEVYLNITKPFDINDAEARRIYIEEYIKGGNAMGINPYLSDAEYAKIKTIDWTEGEDLREFLIDNGYDYDGLVLDEGADGGYGDAVQSRGTSWVVFSPEQVKNIDNVNPTADPDIRFSLSNTVEETKDLLALHNMRSDELLKALNLGGLPMPSVAILKAKDGHDKYGDVSLILPKESIDPRASAYNKVYGGDAWTPTHPRLEYKANAKVDKKISNKYYSLMDTVDRETLRPLYRYVSELESVLNSYGGEAAMLESLYDDTNMMQIYLEDSGKGKVEPIVTESRKEASESEKAVNQYIIDSLGEDVVRAIKAPDGESVGDYRRKFIAEHKEEIASAWEGVCRDVYHMTEEQVQNVMRDTSTLMYMRIVRAAEQYLQNGGVTVETVTNHAATEKAIREKSADGYREWVDSLFKGAEEKTGIRNNLDPFTSSGNRRSWDALHWENTLENVVRAMRAQDQTGADAFAPTSAIFAVAHKQYGSIDEIKADSNRLGRVSEEEYKALEGEYASRLVEIANSIKDPGERNPYIAADNAASLIIDAVRSYKTKAGMLRYMQKWNSRVTAETVNDIVSLVNDIANMPTGYFEAKPQRAVGFEEVGVFVIPRNADIKLKQELLNRGYSIAEYDPDVEGDRTKVLNQFEEYKFSLSDADTLPGNYGNYRVSGEEIAFDDMLPMQEAPVAKTNSQTNQPVSQTNAAVDTEEDLLPMGQETIPERFQSSRPDKAKNLQKLIELDRRYVETISEEIAEKEAQLNAMEHPYSKDAKELRSQIEQLQRKLTNVENNLSKRQEALNQTQMEAEQAAVAEAVAEESAQNGNYGRRELHEHIIDDVKESFAQNGMDFDQVLKNAKNLSTWSTVDNTPQRVMEKALGYKEGKILSDITVDRVARNETQGIKWLNSFTNRKNGLLKQISNQYHIKPGSKESAAAQMYAEGFYVNDKNEIIRYGDPELMQDFPDANVRNNIKGLASDPRIRKIYDDTLAMINNSRTRNAYPEIPRLDNYFLHFRAMDDTFSRLGLPFNPNDIRAKDLPTDLNGVTADLKPGQPYFASAMHRTGKRTSFDLLGGLEKYLTSAKNQIFHIDDIQTLRALRNYIAETFGQANGLENLDSMSNEEAELRIQQVYGSHLSTFAKFLNEEANVIAGKTAMIDRGLEGIIGRRGMTTMDTINQQVGKNMVGFNVSSSLTNFLAVAQAFAKTNKFDFVKALAQTAANKVGSIFGRGDSFAEESPVIIRRNGADRFYRTPWQKAGDAGYVLMSAVDNISTELIARAKYNELTRKGMDSQTAHIETDKWVSRLMGDRSLGQQPQLYNSKMLGLLTKFQLEVRNQLDSQFYDTIQEAKASTEDIQNGLERNAKKAAKIASTFFQLAVAQHLFGTAFESVAGYNPAFDIISVVSTLFGLDDEEDEEDTVLDNVEQAFLELLDDLPYTSILTGGRVPISSALPVEELIKGVDQYGNEKSRWDTLLETAPYYLLPGGYGQIKKTKAGLDMFDDDLPISGSYTDSGNLRYPVEENFWNVAQAGLFGQYANSNARDYFDQGRSALKPNQQREFASLGVDIQDYWDFQDREKKIADMVEAGNAPDMVIIMNKYLNSVRSEMNELLKEEEELLDDATLNGYDKERRLKKIREEYNALAKARFNDYGNVTFDGDYASVGGQYYQWYTPKDGDPEWRKMSDDQVDQYLTTKDAGDAYYATNGKTHYRRNDDNEWEKIDQDQLAKQNKVTHKLGISAEDYWSRKEEYDFAYEYPERYSIAKTVGGYESYKTYSDILNGIKSDYDASGKSISGSRKAKVRNYIWDLDIPEEQKMILFKSQYTADDTYNVKIIKYLNGRRDLTRDEKIMILKKLGFDVDKNGKISW